MVHDTFHTGLSEALEFWMVRGGAVTGDWISWLLDSSHNY